MNYPVSQPGRLLPWDVGEPPLELGGQLTCGFTQFGEVPQQCVPASAVGFKSLALTPVASCWACSAASIISVSRRMSRCIDRSGFGQDGWLQ